jgi:hypothetical protein
VLLQLAQRSLALDRRQDRGAAVPAYQRLERATPDVLVAEAPSGHVEALVAEADREASRGDPLALGPTLSTILMSAAATPAAIPAQMAPVHQLVAAPQLQLVGWG